MLDWQNTTNIVKRQLTNWEDIFATYIMDNGLISLLYKDLLNWGMKKLNRKMEETLE